MMQGTGAGYPLADMLFSVAFTEVVLRHRRELSNASLVVSFPIEGVRAFLSILPTPEAVPEGDVANLNDASFADDLAFVVASAASDIVNSSEGWKDRMETVRRVWLQG